MPRNLYINMQEAGPKEAYRWAKVLLHVNHQESWPEFGLQLGTLLLTKQACFGHIEDAWRQQPVEETHDVRVGLVKRRLSISLKRVGW